MSKQDKHLQNNFTAGELSPLMDARIDLRKYRAGCRTLQNFIVYPQGGAFKRPGFEYAGSVPDRTKPVRLIPFQYSDTDAYILEFSNLRIRFYRTTPVGSGLILDDDNTTVTSLVSPYTTDDLFDLQYAQTGDVMYPTQPDYKPRRLVRTDHNSWAISAPDFARGPFLQENDSATTIEASAVSGNDITLTASADVFQPGHLGALWELTFAKDADPVAGSFAANGNSSEVAVSLGQKLDFTTHGTWAGTIALKASYDGSNWETVYQVSYAGDGNIELHYEEDVADASYRLTMSSYSSGTCNYNLVARRHKVKGVVEITAVATARSATANVKVTLGRAAVPTTVWAEGAWSDYRGWPVAVTFFEQRIFFGKATTIYASKSLPGGDYHNFLAGPLDDAALVFTLAECQQDPIKWLSGDRRLIIGTAGGEYALGATAPTEPMTPTNIGHAEQQSVQGSASIAPIKTSLGHLFIERGGRRVNELVYAPDQEKLAAVDMTRLSSHITTGGIVQTALQKRPEPILWCVTGDGSLIGLTYLREEDVVCWHRHVLGGSATVESVAVIPGDEEDEVWISARIIINSIEQRFVCKMKEWSTVDGSGDPEDAFLVDFGLTYDGDATTTITGLGHLEGETVSILADGAAHADKTVSSGQITLDRSASVVQVGLPYTSTLKPMKIAGGTLGFGSTKRISHAVATFYNTGYAKIGSCAANMEYITFRDAGDLMDSPAPLFTGTKTINFPGGYEKEGNLIIESDKPLPLTILSIDLLTEVS